jgi:hypothetical protein
VNPVPTDDSRRQPGLPIERSTSLIAGSARNFRRIVELDVRLYVLNGRHRDADSRAGLSQRRTVAYACREVPPEDRWLPCTRTVEGPVSAGGPRRMDGQRSR